MTRPIPLAEALDPAAFGSKAAGLAQVTGLVPVPDGLVLPGGWLAGCLGGTGRAELGRLLAALPGCPERAVPGLVAEIGERAAAVSPDLPELGDRLGELLVVRSSSADEDGEHLSFAGVFESLVNVGGAGLADAVRLVWLSGFGPRALLAYRRAGRAPRPDHLSVLVQRAVQPAVAGVAFSEPGGEALVEWTAGHGADLVGGSAVPTRERLGRAAAAAGWRAGLHAALAALPPAGHDVEWAWDGTALWVVQVRPRTAALGARAGAGVRAAPLYEADAPELVLGECAEDYWRIRAKRRGPRAIAIGQGARVPAGWLANWEPATGPEPLRAWTAQLPARVVVDASPAERQYIIERAELPATISRLAASGTVVDSQFPFLCREFLQGELALLSTVAADGSVYVEASAEGLLALNRGFGSARPLPEAELRELLGEPQLAALCATTHEHAHRLHPRATLEWVVEAGRLYFVDHSAPRSAEPAPAGGIGHAQVLSGGVARGLVRHLHIDAMLTESSIAPIVSISQPTSAEHESQLLGQLHDRLELTGEPVIVAAARPIAMLSVLIGVAAGFLFEEGALLSHLGILLREAGVPAAIVGTGNLPPDGIQAELVHGTVLVDTPAR
ncbi:MAG TPA: PEP/pyruvate-binding domain-containing protein [Jatrophihabitans sp.]|nr:PEP/pyruvate-binding domain-containing protein [Jatrophihabitans sp.]